MQAEQHTPGWPMSSQDGWPPPKQPRNETPAPPHTVDVAPTVAVGGSAREGVADGLDEANRTLANASNATAPPAQDAAFAAAPFYFPLPPRPAEISTPPLFFPVARLPLIGEERAAAANEAQDWGSRGKIREGFRALQTKSCK